MWRVCKEAGRSWPVICPEDDVIDYMIMEAVYLKVNREDREAQKEQERAEWKKNKVQELKKYT
jgi:hypothetical protein